MYRKANYVGCYALLGIAIAGCQKADLPAAPNTEKAAPAALRTEATPEATGVAQTELKQHKKMSACADKFYPKYENDPATAKIFAALAQPTTIDFSEVPLRDVLDDLEKQHQIEIQLDNRALDDAGIETDTPMTLRLKNITLRSVLRIMLRDMDLTFIIKDEVLLITTPEVSENHLVTRLYDVRELTISKYDDKRSPDIGAVIELIQSVVAPTTWDSVGGPGSFPSYDGVLVVNQTDEVHGSISRLLTQLCRLKNDGIERGTISIPITEMSAGLPEDAPIATKNIAAIHAALKSETQLDFDETPLREAIVALAKAHAINVTLDYKALDESGIETDTPITLNLSGITLRSALTLMLRDMDLTYIVKDEVLLITTPEVEENRLVARLYPVGDLVVTVELNLTQKLLRASDKPRTDYEVLRSIIQRTVSPTTWGLSTVAVYEPAECFVIATTQEVHSQVKGLFVQLRDVLGRRSGPPPKLATSIPPDRVMTLVYSIGPAVVPATGGFIVEPGAKGKKSRVDVKPKDIESPIITSNALAEKIKKHIATESWQDKQFTIDALPHRLVIRQTYAVHKQIARFLEHLNQLAISWQGWEEAIQNVADPAPTRPWRAPRL